MANIQAVLQEKLRAEATHVETGDVVINDTPVVVGGREEMMGPTEVLAASLANCILIMMGIEANKLGIDLVGARAEVHKEVVYRPIMRISELKVLIKVPLRPSDDQISRLEAAARMCPVHNSLSSEVNEELNFEWGAS